MKQNDETTKKPYQPPAVRRVNLVSNDAILAVCHSSPNLTPKGATPCAVTLACYNPPT